jgi:hypothetical protein
VIGERVARLNERLAEHEAGAARASVELTDAAAFDPGAESERLHKLQSARHRELVRTVELVGKLRNDPLPEEGSGQQAAGSRRQAASRKFGGSRRQAAGRRSAGVRGWMREFPGTRRTVRRRACVFTARCLLPAACYLLLQRAALKPRSP